MDVAQKLIYKILGEEDNYQSVLNTQKNTAIPFQPVYQDHIQLLHDGGSHWFLTFCSSDRVQICDSLKSSLNHCSKESIYSLYKHVVGEYDKVNPTFLPAQKQPDGFNCGVFAIAFAAESLDGCRIRCWANEKTFNDMPSTTDTYIIPKSSKITIGFVIMNPFSSCFC